MCIRDSKLIERSGIDLDSDFEGKPFKEVVMAPTKLYVKSILALKDALPIKGMAHITGGGLTENIPRVLQDGLTAEIDSSAWTLPPLFKWLQEQGNIAAQEMYKTFNCGIGMAVIIDANDVAQATQLLQEAGETVYTLGKIRAQAEGEAQTIVI